MAMCWRRAGWCSKAPRRRCGPTIGSGRPISECKSTKPKKRLDSRKRNNRSATKQAKHNTPEGTMTDHTPLALTRRTMLAATALSLAAPRAFEQAAADVRIGLIVPLSGLYARPGAVMRMGAEMGVEHVNSAGGVKALGGAKLKLVVIDCGDTTEKA